MPFVIPADFGQDRDQPTSAIPKEFIHRRVRLPDDELQHPDTMEWWYFKAHLVVGDPPGRRVSLFVAILKQDVFRTPMSVALVRLTDHREGPQPLLAVATPFGYAYQSDDEFRFNLAYKFGAPAITKASTLALSNGRIGGQPSYRIAISGQHEITLDLTETRRHVMLGDHGTVTYGGGAQLAYWARPFLQASGTMSVAGQSAQVSGVGWLERQWGDANVADYAWSYFPVQLDSGERYLFYRTVHLATKAVSVHGVYFAADGASTVLRDVTFIRGKRTFPRRPSLTLDWNIRCQAPHPVDLTIRPLFEDQLIHTNIPRVPTFYEGVSKVCDASERAVGWSMTELHNH